MDPLHETSVAFMLFAFWNQPTLGSSLHYGHRAQLRTNYSEISMLAILSGFVLFKSDLHYYIALLYACWARRGCCGKANDLQSVCLFTGVVFYACKCLTKRNVPQLKLHR